MDSRVLKDGFSESKIADDFGRLQDIPKISTIVREIQDSHSGSKHNRSVRLVEYSIYQCIIISSSLCD